MKQANTANGELSRASARDYEYRSISTIVLQIYEQFAENCRFTVKVRGQL
jgi:hypothetical protein